MVEGAKVQLKAGHFVRTVGVSVVRAISLTAIVTFSSLFFLAEALKGSDCLHVHVTSSRSLSALSVPFPVEFPSF